MIGFENAEHRMKQLGEAARLLEEFNDRLAWAYDFSKYKDISDMMDELMGPVAQAQDRLENLITETEDALDGWKMEKARLESDVEHELVGMSMPEL